jgi:hypothetical protein
MPLDTTFTLCYISSLMEPAFSLSLSLSHSLSHSLSLSPPLCCLHYLNINRASTLQAAPTLDLPTTTRPGQLHQGLKSIPSARSLSHQSGFGYAVWSSNSNYTSLRACLSNIFVWRKALETHAYQWVSALQTQVEPTPFRQLDDKLLSCL